MSAAPVLAPVSAARTPPHNLDAEKSALGSVFISPAVFEDLAAILQVDDFFLPAHREVFEAMLAVDARRRPLDPISVGDELRVRGLLARLDGGESYLLSLANSVPTADNAVHYARIVRDKAVLRQAIAAAAELQSVAHGDVGLVSEFLEEHRAQLERIAALAVVGVRPAADLVDRLIDAGEALATGLRTLDANCRGGFRRGRRIIVAGAPGAGKTTLALCWALAWAMSGVYVAILAADECAADLLIRLGQMLGLDRDELEAGHPQALDALRRELQAIPTLLILDGDDGATVEDAVIAVRKLARDGRAAIVVDGVQTARATGSDDAESPRARVDAVLAALRRASQRHLVVVATSELARAGYRSTDPSQRIDDLAAAKESGAVEYMAQTLMVLRPVPDRIGEVDVAIPKNRGGDRTPLRLVIDFARARMHETLRPADSDGAAPDPAAELSADMERAREVLRASPAGIAGAEVLLARLGRSKARGRAAIRTLEARGEIRVERGPGTARRLFLDANPPNPPRPLRGAGVGAGQRSGLGDWADPPGGEKVG